jgi:hypothetical protein
MTFKDRCIDFFTFPPIAIGMVFIFVVLLLTKGWETLILFPLSVIVGITIGELLIWLFNR